MNKPRTYTPEEADALVMSAIRQGNRRAMAILSSEQAKGRQALATYLAFETSEQDISTEAAIECLKLSTREQGQDTDALDTFFRTGHWGRA
jgi:hypothetical protein